MKNDSLESKSLWYKYKTEVWLQNTPEAIAIHNIMRFLRSIHNTKNLAYISTPITSSKWFYERLRENPELNPEKLLKETIDNNYSSGCSFLKSLIERTDKQIIYPADMVPIGQDWEQTHFQALWLSMISEKCSELHMNKDWEYSNGGSEELTHVVQLRLGIPKHKDILFYNTKGNEATERERMRNIQVYDCEGKSISLSDSINSLDKSLSWIKEGNFKPKRLENCRELLEWTGDMIEKGFYQ